MSDKNNNKEFKFSDFSDGSGVKMDVYSPDPRTNPHDTVHIKINYENKSYTATTKIDGKKEESSGSCYLTTACMKHFCDKFDDNCYELQVLRWFRDHFVSKSDIEYYYKTAPIIVETIDNTIDNNHIYLDIYQNVVQFCVQAIELGQYGIAYERYKDSILTLEEQYARPELEMKLVKCLKAKNKIM